MWSVVVLGGSTQDQVLQSNVCQLMTQVIHSNVFPLKPMLHRLCSKAKRYRLCILYVKYRIKTISYSLYHIDFMIWTISYSICLFSISYLSNRFLAMFGRRIPRFQYNQPLYTRVPVMLLSMTYFQFLDTRRKLFPF